MDQQGLSVAEQPGSEIVAQLAALTALVQAQGEKLAAQDEEIGRLKAAASPAVQAQPPAEVAPSKVGRRGWLRTVAGATAAAALLTMAKEASTAHANARGSLTQTPSTDKYGLVAAWGDNDPGSYLDLVTGSQQRFGVIGINYLSGFPAPTAAGILGITDDDAGVCGTANSGRGVHGVASNGIGVWGETRSATNNSIGVVGVTTGTVGNTVGVWGRSVSPTGRGVLGENTATTGTTSGVHGRVSSTDTAAAGVSGAANGISGQTYGVRGTTFSNTPNSSGVKGEAIFGATNAVWGENFSSDENATGVFGLASQPSGNTVGVWGRSNSNAGGAVGVYGHVTAANAAGIGVRGDSPAGVGAQTTSGNALVGITAANNVAAILGQNIGGLAARFIGNVIVQGGVTVTGGPKSAAVTKRDGTHVRMYCQESPEPWFEDFGTAELKNGQASVALDPEFDEVVKGDDYRVFLTPIGVDCSLYVSRKGPHRFEVRSVGGAAKDGSFDYRVVARRGDDIGKRLEKVAVPAQIDDKSLAPDASRAERPKPASAEPPKPEKIERPEPSPAEKPEE